MCSGACFTHNTKSFKCQIAKRINVLLIFVLCLHETDIIIVTNQRPIKLTQFRSASMVFNKICQFFHVIYFSFDPLC